MNWNVNSFWRVGRCACKRAWVALFIGLGIISVSAAAEDLAIHMSGNAKFSRKTVQYTCDASGAKIGVPSGPFSVEYINGGGNSLVVIPISGNSLIFTNAMSASGARYTTREYTWWDAHGSATLYFDSLSGKAQSVCQPVANK